MDWKKMKSGEGMEVVQKEEDGRKFTRGVENVKIKSYLKIGNE